MRAPLPSAFVTFSFSHKAPIRGYLWTLPSDRDSLFSATIFFLSFVACLCRLPVAPSPFFLYRYYSTGWMRVAETQGIITGRNLPFGRSNVFFLWIGNDRWEFWRLVCLFFFLYNERNFESTHLPILFVGKKISFVIFFSCCHVWVARFQM